MYLKIDSMDLDLEKAFKNYTVATVHSIYSSVINIDFKHSSKLFSIAINNIIQSPYMMRTEDIEKFMRLTESIQVGDSVNLIQKNQLRIGLFVIDWSFSSKWENRIEEYRRTNKELRIRYKKLKEYLTENAPDNQIVKALSNEKPKETDYFQKKYLKIINQIKKEHKLEILSHLIGLGIGLTPSGDDFFVGCFSVFYCHKKSWAKKIKANRLFSLDSIRTRTTQVSFNMIMHAFDGKVNEELYQILSEPELSEDRLKSLQKIGSSSGEDMLAGICFAYYLLVNNYKEENNDYKSKN